VNVSELLFPRVSGRAYTTRRHRCFCNIKSEETSWFLHHSSMDEFLWVFSLIFNATSFHLLCLLALTVEWLSKIWKFFIVFCGGHCVGRTQWGSCGLVLPGALAAEFFRQVSLHKRPKCTIRSCLLGIYRRLLSVRQASGLLSKPLFTSSYFKRGPSVTDRGNPVDNVLTSSSALVSQMLIYRTHYSLIFNKSIRRFINAHISSLILASHHNVDSEDVLKMPGSYPDIPPSPSQTVVNSPQKVSPLSLVSALL
jgi:hypothetical protein